MPDPVHPTEQSTMSFAIASADSSFVPPDRFLAHLVPDDQARERFLDEKFGSISGRATDIFRFTLIPHRHEESFTETRTYQNTKHEDAPCVPLTPKGLEDRWCGPTEVNTAIKHGGIPPIDCHLCSSLPRAVQSALPFMVATDVLSVARDTTVNTDTIGHSDVDASADSIEPCTWNFVLLDLLRELPGRVAPAVGDLMDLSKFDRLCGPDSVHNEAGYLLAEQDFSRTMELQSSAMTADWRRQVERSISNACMDFLFNLALGINDRTSQSDVCFLVTGHSGLFNLIHRETLAMCEDPHCRDTLAYGGKRAYTRTVRREGTAVPEIKGRRENAAQRSQRLQREKWTCRTIAPGRRKGGDGPGPRTEAEMRKSLGSSPFTAPAWHYDTEEADSDTDESGTSGDH